MSESEFGNRMQITASDGTADRQFYLFPAINYGFHRQLHEIWDSYGFRSRDKSKKAIIVPSLFSKHTRKFHWFSVAAWDASPYTNGKNIVNPNNIIDAIRIEIREEETNRWDAFCINVKGCQIPGALKQSKKALEYISGYLKSNDPIPENEWIIAFQHLLTLYSEYHHETVHYLDGIVWRNLKEIHTKEKSCSKKIDYLLGPLVGKKEVNFVEYPWIEATFYFNNDVLEIEAYQCQELNICGTALRPLTPGEIKEIESWQGFPIAKTLTNKIFFDYVQTEAGGKTTFVLVIPIYDAWIGSEAWGSLCGNLILFFGVDKQNDFYYQSFVNRGSTEKPLLDELKDKTRIFTGEFFRSGLNLLLAQPINPPYDLIRHFLKILNIIQDWDRIIVYRGTIPQYCYYWSENPDEWKQCNCGTGASNEGSCAQCPPWDATSDNKKFVRWEKNFDIWSDTFLYDINDEEKLAFHDIRLAFKYPVTACIPEEDETKCKMLGEEYIRQQLEVLRGLLPKVRARRAALRSALSAIMGRNMSHNIGSHVLARYSSRVKDDRNEVVEGNTDHRGDFLTYLQRRMDFLAEVATSDRAFWSQPLSLKEQIGRLNYGEQQQRFAGEKKHTCNQDCSYHHSPRRDLDDPVPTVAKPIILSYITGKESLLASVEYGVPEGLCGHNDHNDRCKNYLNQKTQDDFWFDCPSGEVGVHALFIILENIIRNSARHGGTSEDTVRVFVGVEDESNNDNLLKLEIIDPRTKLESDGRLFKDGLSAEDRKKEEEEARQELEELQAKGVYSLPDKNDSSKRRTLKCLDKDINSILRDEPFLDASGNPNPQYWGVREMQICAHYLRWYPLSDLEGFRDEKPVLEAGVHKLADESHCLKYTLYLQRAKLMLAVVADDTEYRDKTNELRRKGIHVRDDKPECKISSDVSRYSFLVVQEGIDIRNREQRESASLPVRTFGLPLEKIKQALNDKSPGIAWMESLHETERLRYQKKREAWETKDYWGLDARQSCNSESTNGIWRRVQLNLDQGRPGQERSMWPLKDSHANMVRGLRDNEIAALWVDHPKPECFESFDNALGCMTLLYRVAIPPKGREPSLRWIHVEATMSDSTHKAVLDSAAEKKLYQELMAAAMPRVAVLDERVQSAAETNVRNIPLRHLWRSMGVWVPEKQSCDLDTPREEKFKAFLGNPSSHTEQYPIDYLVIHLTVLERLHNDRQNKTYTFAQTLGHLIHDTQAACSEVYVVTGRGVPTITRPDDVDYLPNVRYLPVSAILEYLVTRPSKLGLMRVLWSAGRPETHKPS